MAEFHKLLATLKSALASGEPQPPAPAAERSAVPMAAMAQRAELVSRFARELEAVGGHFMGLLAPAEAAEKTVALAKRIRAGTAALGDGAACDIDALAAALEAGGIRVIRAGAAADGARAETLQRLARAGLGIAEADYAIAATGTLAVLADSSRPQSLTLLPPACLIMVHAGRLVADLAAAIAALGPRAIASHRMSLITGPSRTADIEKRIVVGVHGPSELYVAMIWPRS